MATIDLSSFHLTFDDEFNGLSASPDGNGTTWETKYWWGGRDMSTYSLLDGSVGGLGQTPYHLANGALDIHAQPTTSALQAAGVTDPFTTGQIDTHNSFSQEYGYFEMRAQVSGSYGTNSAFWLMPMSGPWPPEIDTAEVLGRDPKTDYMTNHANSTHPTSYGGTATGVDLSQGYHTYGVLWTPTTMTFYLDGVAEYTTPTQPDEHQPMYLLATLGVGGSWSGDPNPSTFNADMKIDYIRVYSQDSAIPAVSLQHVSSPDGVDTTPYGTTTADGVIHQGGTGTGTGGSDGSGSTDPGTGSTGSSGSTGGTGTPPVEGNLVVHVSEDAYQGDAQFTVSVDGHQVGGIQTATASHAAGQWQDVMLSGDFGAGTHTVDVNFLNDAWGGSADNDRNLYVGSVTLDGHTVSGTAAANDADNGFASVDPSAAVMDVNGHATFTVDDTTGTGTGTGTGTDPGTGTGTGTGTGSTTGSLVLHVSEDAWQGDAQFTVLVDGHQVGGTQTATADHAAGQWQDIALAGDFGTGPHTIDVNFLNDAWGGSADTDRNLYVGSVTINGETVSGSTATNHADNGLGPVDPSAAVMDVNGAASFHATGTGSTTGGTSPTQSTIVLHLSEDAWQGDAQFNVLVDGHQVGGTQAVTASHAAGQVQDITVTGDFGSTGPDSVSVQFLNDAWGGSAATDRNLYVQSVDVNGQHFAGNTAANDAANGYASVDPTAAVMDVNGTATFDIHHSAPPDLLLG